MGARFVKDDRTKSAVEAQMKYDHGKLNGRNMYLTYGIVDGKKLYWGQIGNKWAGFKKYGETAGTLSFFSRKDAEEYIKNSAFPNDILIEEKFFDSSFFHSS